MLFFVFYNILSSNGYDCNSSAVTPRYSLLKDGIGESIIAGNQLLSLAIVVNSIYDRKYIDHLSILKEAGFNNPGRNFTLSIKILFGIK